MRYIIDHDLHIHSRLSICSEDPEQTADTILAYAKANSLDTVCMTDHYWDKAVPGAPGFYDTQDFAHIEKIKPLPTDAGIRFLFGCETDMNYDMTIGVPQERFDDFDFIIVPINHLHFDPQTIPTEHKASAELVAQAWIKKFRGVLCSDLPLKKTGLAHLTCTLTTPGDREMLVKVFDLISDSVLEELFGKAAECGIGIELNSDDIKAATELPTLFRPYKIAKKMGCKFYLGSDAHSRAGHALARERFEKAIDILGLEESDKFVLS